MWPLVKFILSRRCVQHVAKALVAVFAGLCGIKLAADGPGVEAGLLALGWVLAHTWDFWAHGHREALRAMAANATQELQDDIKAAAVIAGALVVTLKQKKSLLSLIGNPDVIAAATVLGREGAAGVGEVKAITAENAPQVGAAIGEAVGRIVAGLLPAAPTTTA